MTRPAVDPAMLARSIALALRLVARHHGLGAIAVDVQVVRRENGEPGIAVEALPLSAQEIAALLGEPENN